MCFIFTPPFGVNMEHVWGKYGTRFKPSLLFGKTLPFQVTHAFFTKKLIIYLNINAQKIKRTVVQ